jgi:hypothetical protein
MKGTPREQQARDRHVLILGCVDKEKWLVARLSRAANTDFFPFRCSWTTSPLRADTQKPAIFATRKPRLRTTFLVHTA